MGHSILQPAFSVMVRLCQVVCDHRGGINAAVATSAAAVILRVGEIREAFM